MQVVNEIHIEETDKIPGQFGLASVFQYKLKPTLFSAGAPL
jgi:hypothetical protein